MVCYKYQQRSLQRWVLTRNSSNSRLTSFKYFFQHMAFICKCTRFPSYCRDRRATIAFLTNIFVLKALGWCFPDISAVGRSSLLLAERSSFSLISCSTLISYYLSLLQIYIDVKGGVAFSSDDTQIRTTEEQAYKRTVYLLDHNVTLIYILFSPVKFINKYQASIFHDMRIIFFSRWHPDSNQRRPVL